MTSVHLTNAYHPSSGGVRTVYRALLEAANRLERRACLIVPGPQHAVEDVGAFGRIYYVKAPLSFAFDRRYRLISPTSYVLPGRARIAEILRAEQPDIVEICDKLSLFYLAGLLRKGWLRGIPRPLLVGLSAERFDDVVRAFVSPRQSAQRLAAVYMRQLYAPLFDYHLANSEYTASELRASLAPHRQRVVRVCPPGVEDDVFDVVRPTPTERAHLLQRTGGSRYAVLLLCAGRLSPEKNLPLLIETMARLTAADARGRVDYRLVVAGDGPLRSALEQRAQAECPGRVLFLGNIADRGQFLRLLGSVDIVVHPNPREPFGIAPLEAMAAGVPLVVGNRGGVRSYASDDTAWLAEPTGEAFARAVRDVVAHPEDRARRARRARLKAEEFRFPRVMDRTFALYDELRDDFDMMTGCRRRPPAPVPIPSHATQL